MHEDESRRGVKVETLCLGSDSRPVCVDGWVLRVVRVWVWDVGWIGVGWESVGVRTIGRGISATEAGEPGGRGVAGSLYCVETNCRYTKKDHRNGPLTRDYIKKGN
jgi:hypothetical protein